MDGEAQHRGGMDVPAQTLEELLLRDVHDWILVPASLGFRENVEQVTNPRPDIAQYQLIAQDNREIAKNLFSELCRSTTLFRIPDTIVCSRTYARDNEEAYYVDAMDAYINSPPGELDVNDIPLLKGRLHGRIFCAFSRKPGYRSELFERRRIKAWIPYDVPTLRHFGDTVILSLFPRVEAWLDLINAPPALAIPLPFVGFYFHHELRIAQLNPVVISERLRRLEFCLRKEYHILFMTMWWNELYYGGRVYILETSTIDVLNNECGSVHNIAGKPAQAIIAHMRMAAGIPSVHHNWMYFEDNCMEPSTFVWCIRRNGALDTTMPARTRYYCSNERSVGGKGDRRRKQMFSRHDCVRSSTRYIQNL